MGFPRGLSIQLRRYSDAEWQVTSDIVYRGKRDTFTVPVGFRTDFASVPRVGVWLIPKFGRWTLAAIVHDLLCVGLKTYYDAMLQYEMAVKHLPGSMWPPKPTPPLANARDTDRIFVRIMRELDVPWLLRWLMWTGVRYGAVANPARRAGWLADLPRLVPLTLMALPIVLPAALAILFGLAVYTGLEFVCSLLVRRESPEDVGVST